VYCDVLIFDKHLDTDLLIYVTTYTKKLFFKPYMCA